MAADTQKDYSDLSLEEFDALPAQERLQATEDAFNGEIARFCRLVGTADVVRAMELLKEIPLLYTASTIGMLGQMLHDLRKIVPDEPA